MNATRNHTMGSTFGLAPAAGDTPKTFSPAAAGFPAGVQGLDVSGWQTNVDWASVYANGARFAYVKATEDLTYQSSQFSQQYNGAYNAGLIRGAYHFATPNTSSGAAQARYFVANGGGWSADGRTLPPLLDIEYNPYGGDTCWGLTPSQMVSWVSDFTSTVLTLTGRAPAIYTNTNWWNRCTGNYGGFGSAPLFVAYYPNNVSTGAGTLPSGWSTFTFWQFAAGGAFPGDQDVFNGSLADLQSFALGNRLAGSDAFGTSAALSATFAPQPYAAYIASGYSFPDALAGGPAAGHQKSPVLLVQPYGIPDVIATELTRLKPQNIFVLGGPQAVSDATLNALRSYTSGMVVRLMGSDRYETSVAVSQWVFPPKPAVTYIATGMNFPDALSGAAVAAGVRSGPLLLVTPTSIPSKVATELGRLQSQSIVVLGGTDVISADVVSQLQSYTSGSVTRIAGDDRYSTSAAVSRASFAPGVATAYVAVGDRFPDALSGAPVAGTANAPVLLVQSDALPGPIATELSRLKPHKIVILGGNAAVSPAVAAQLQNYVVN